MITLKCLSCGLTVAYRESHGDLCPRCLVRGGRAVQLVPVSDRQSRPSQPSIGRLSINAKRQGERHTLLLTGEIDVASAPVLAGTIADLCAGGAQEIVLDLCGVEFVDSSGLGAILRGKAICDEHSCAFSLTPAQRPVQRMFDVAGVKDRLRFRGKDARRSPRRPQESEAST
jgi:anti-sigma B factor antagonist